MVPFVRALVCEKTCEKSHMKPHEKSPRFLGDFAGELWEVFAGGRGAQKIDGCLSGFYGTGDRKGPNREKPHKSRVSGQLASGICEVSREKWCEKSHTKSPRKLTENLREIYTIIRDRDRVKDRERDKDIIIARSSNLLRSLASKPAPEFPMKGLPDHGYLEPGEPIAIRGDRASDDE